MKFSAAARLTCRPPCQHHGLRISLNEQTVKAPRIKMLWDEGSNDYGPEWDASESVFYNGIGTLARSAGTRMSQPPHVRHIQPFRSFTSREAANQLQTWSHSAQAVIARLEPASELQRHGWHQLPAAQPGAPVADVRLRRYRRALRP